MNGTKVMWAQLALVLGLTLAGLWTATQWTAWRLAFQPQLGRPWFELAGWPVYSPPAFLWWWFAFDAYAPRIFLAGAAIAVSGAGIAIVASLGLSVWRARGGDSVTAY